MAQFTEFVKMAISNIRLNKGRSMLTMLGIIIGISSVIAIMSIGNGAKNSINDELNAMAGGQVYIYSNESSDAGTIEIEEEDMDAIRENVEGVKAVTPQYGYWGTSRSEKGSFDSVVYFGNPDLQFITNPTMVRGRYFTWEDFERGSAVAVIRQASAKKLFGTDDVVGLSFEYDLGYEILNVTIVGVSQDMEGMMTGDSTSYLNFEMPYRALSDYAENPGFSSIYLFADNSQAVAVGQEALSYLEGRHQVRGMEAFLMQDFDSQMGEIQSVLNMITIFIIFVAAISLLVGGIGVMNIMLVSVTERTREIGIRKALGARTKSIMLQFLSESAIITGIGGVIGIILGLLIAKGVCLLPMVSFTPAISIPAIVMATLFSCCVGLFFGIYPAKKAAKLSPIEALRRE